MRPVKQWLAVWWVSCVAVAWWKLWDLPVMVGLTAVSAAVFVVLMLRWPPHRGVIRLAVYMSALIATQTSAATGGVWPLLPGNNLHEVHASVERLASSSAQAVLAVAAFLLVRAWVSDGGRFKHVPRRQPSSWLQIAGLGAVVALLYWGAIKISNDLWLAGADLVGVAVPGYPYAPGQFADMVLVVATTSLAGAIEEPIYVGLLVLLWPRLRLRTFIPLAALSSVARSVMHLYYAADAEVLAAAIGLVVLWCAMWSSAALLLIYRSRMLWPVVVGHGMSNVFAAMGGPFKVDETLLNYAVVAVPFLVFIALVMAASLYASSRIVEVMSERWPRLKGRASAQQTN